MQNEAVPAMQAAFEKLRGFFHGCDYEQAVTAMIRKRLADDTGGGAGHARQRDIDAAVRQVIGSAIDADERAAPRIVRIYTLRGFESVLAGSVQVSTGTKTSLSFQDGPVFTRVHRREGPAAPRGSRARTHGTTISQPTWPGVPDRLHPAHGAGAGPATFRDPRGTSWVMWQRS